MCNNQEVMIEEKVKLLLDEQSKKMKDLCAYIEITDSGIRKIFKRDSCEISDLKKISAFFKVKPSFFIEEGCENIIADNNSIAVSGNENTINGVTEKFLDLLQKKDEQIDRLLTLLEKKQQ